MRAQEQQGIQPQQVQQLRAPNYITSGFYMKFGPVFPTGAFATGTTFTTYTTNPVTPVPLIYLPAKIGAAMDLGYLIYIGPAFANNRLRAGIDATFLTFSFNSTQPINKDKVANHYYYFGGQKFGPVFTINPVDKLMIDLSYKLNANFCYYYGEWENISDDLLTKYGVTYLQNEVSISLRYRIAAFSFQYNFGNVTYDNVSSTKPTDRAIDVSTYRILIGLKF
jgi:hypothetical protein